MVDILDRLWERSEVPLFAYGTLRQGSTRHGWVQNILTKQPQRCHTERGYDLMRHMVLDYPLMVRTGDENFVHGELQWLRVGNELLELVHMELDAGFVMSLVNINWDSFAEPVPALSFLMPRTPKATPIATGDWLNR